MTTTLSDSLADLLSAAVHKHAEPLWPVLETLSTREPAPKAVPHVWRYDELRPFCERAARLVGTADAERRVFMLVNPGLAAPHTTDTLFAGLQTILPGEVARAHRHTAFALRFVIEGDGAYTAVEGEKIEMQRGDMILTPQWDWHDHGNEGTGPVIWLDGLDLPLWSALPVLFTEKYGRQRYPAEVNAGLSQRRFSWNAMQAELDAEPGAVAALRYRSRIHGGEISLTIGASAVRIDAGARSESVRETASAVYHVVEGSGISYVGDDVLVWKRGDTFAVPAWHTACHIAGQSGPAYLFRYDDRPLVEAVNAYRADHGSF
jgi:gentisate 1,2-dioxygenase